MPISSGIYFYVRQSGEIVYIGKANNLSHRLSHHFTGDQQLELVKGGGVLRRDAECASFVKSLLVRERDEKTK